MKVASPVGPSKIEDYAFLSDTQSGARAVRIDRALGAPALRWSGSDCGTGWDLILRTPSRRMAKTSVRITAKAPFVQTQSPLGAGALKPRPQSLSADSLKLTRSPATSLAPCTTGGEVAVNRQRGLLYSKNLPRGIRPGEDFALEVNFGLRSRRCFGRRRRFRGAAFGSSRGHGLHRSRFCRSGCGSVSVVVVVSVEVAGVLGRLSG